MEGRTIDLAGDPALLARFRAGDQEALATVYRAHFDEVCRVLRHGFGIKTATGPGRVPGLKDAFAVESACHEVFVRAFKPSARAAYDARRPYGHYLFGIARNLRIDLHRRRRAEPTPPESFEGDADEGPPVDVLYQREAQRARVRAYLETLPATDRAYVDGRFEGGLSQTDAAAALGLTRIQGRRIEARVKAGLRRHLLRETGEDDHGV